MRRLSVKDVMTTDVVTTQVDTPFKVVASLLDERKVSALPVLDGDGRLVGIVSEADLLIKEGHQAEPVHGSLLHPKRIRLERAKAEGTVAGEIMTSPVMTISPAASLVEAARTMSHEQVKRLPVIDAGGALVGIVSRADLVKVFLRPDEEIKDDIREQVFSRILLTEPSSYRVDVTNGVVTLSGRLDSKSSVDIADRLVRSIDGVVDVDNKLTFRFDDSESRVMRSMR